MTFAEKFCHENRIELPRYREEVLRRALYPRALSVRNFLRLIPGYFDPDHELIDAVGRLTDMAGFDSVEADYRQDEMNRTWLRRRLNLRVSVRRLRSVVQATLEAPQS